MAYNLGLARCANFSMLASSGVTAIYKCRAVVAYDPILNSPSCRHVASRMGVGYLRSAAVTILLHELTGNQVRGWSGCC
jgi:hypothetical protein